MTTTRIAATLIAHPAVQAPRLRQRGIATIMILILVGLSLTVAVLGAMHFTRGAQDQLMTVHAQTAAQMQAWTGAEVVRKFLVQLQTSKQLTTLANAIISSPGLPIVMDGLPGVSAKFVSVKVDAAGKPTEFVAEITGVTAAGTKAESTSTLNVVYAQDNQATNTPSIKVGTFTGGLKIGGGMAVITETTSGGFELNVIGDLFTTGNSITGVNKINSTGSISIDSGSTFDMLNANCDVRLTGAVTAGTINARRNVCLSGGASGTNAINANGSVVAANDYSKNGAIAAIGNPTDVASCKPSGFAGDDANHFAATCDAPSTTYVVDLSSGSAGAKSVKSKGSVTLGSGHIGDIRAEGDLNVNWGATVDSGAITGTVNTPSQYFNKSTVKVTENSTGLSVSIPSVSRVTLTTYIIDAYDYQSIANYIFKVDAGGYKKVTVSNVSGIANGEYFLGSYAAGNNDKVDYLCTTLASGSSSGNPACLGAYNAATSPPTICKGFSPQNACFGYDSSTKTWSINGKSIAQGIAWFEGNLSVASGSYYNTFIATKNITTSGADKVYATNFAGYSGSVGGVQYAPTGICENVNFPNIYPRQFCETSTNTYLSDANSGIGNYAFVAGSVPSRTYSGGGSYDGGNVNTGASTELFGNVMAGNEFTSSGETTIHGYVTALGSGVTTNNSISAKTTYRLIELPPTFNPNGSVTTSSQTTSSGMKILWSRYL